MVLLAPCLLLSDLTHSHSRLLIGVGKMGDIAKASYSIQHWNWLPSLTRLISAKKVRAGFPLVSAARS